MKILKKLGKIVLGLVLVIVIGVIVLALLPARTPKIEATSSAVSVAEIEKVMIGGIEQTLLIRGNDINNPVILFVHGGPGQGEAGYMRNFQQELEEEFIVVRWEQRVVTKDLTEEDIKKNFTMEQFLEDADQVTDYLRSRFNKDKIFISGHSWGTVPGVLAAKNNPEKYLAYIGVGQLVHMKQNEQACFDFAMQKATEIGAQEDIVALKAIGVKYNIDNVIEYRAYINKYGGVMKPESEKQLVKSLFTSSEYRLADKLLYRKRVLATGKAMSDILFNIDLWDIKAMPLPIYIIAGESDYCTSVDIAKEFYKQLKAPKKELIIMEDTAHMPQIDDSKRFNEIIIQIKKDVMIQ